MSDAFELSRSSLRELLLSRGKAQEALFARAREARAAVNGDSAYVRGVVELTSHCRKDCDYCAMRLSNRALARFRATPDDVMAAARAIRDTGIPTILIQGGEDVVADKVLDAVIPRIKQELGLFVILNVGERKRSRLEAFRSMGADAFIMKFETADAPFYDRHTRTSWEARMRNLRWLRELGFVVGTGNIVGLPGQTVEHLVDDLLLARDLAPDYVSSSPFIPNEGTPWDLEPHGDLDTTLNCIAACRLLFPTALIPTVSALEKVSPGGQRRGFMAGANVITINFTPTEQRARYRIYSRERFVVSHGHAMQTLAEAGLRPLASYAATHEPTCLPS